MKRSDDNSASGTRGARSAGSKGPWYRDGLRFECTQCGGCCKAHGDYDRVYVDDDEAVAIAELLGISLEEFEEHHAVFESDSDGDRDRYLRFVDGACPFLKGTSCKVYDARPIQCRTWPFWPENLKRKVWNNEVAPFTPGVGRGRLYKRAEIDDIARLMPE